MIDTYPSSALCGCILLYYLVTSLLATLRQPENQLKLGRKGQIFLLSTTTLILVISACLCVADALTLRSKFRVKVIDDELFADLLQLLQWLVLLLSHIDHPGVVRYPHYGTWILLAIGSGLRKDPSLWHLTYVTVNAKIGLAFARIVLSALLVLTTSALQRLARRAIRADDDEENQPLLAASNSGTRAKDEPEEEDEEEEDSRRELAERKKAREELHNRPTAEYLRSFSVYLPIVWPKESRQKLYFVGTCLCMLSLRVVAALMPLALASIIDTLTAGDAPWLPIFGYFVLYFLDSRTGILLLEDYLQLLMHNYQQITLGRVAYNHVMDLSADFQDSKTSSEIWQAMQQAQSVIELFYGVSSKVTPMFIDLITGFVLVWTIFGAYMGWLVMTLIVLIIWTCIKSIKSRVSLSRKWRDSWYDSYHQMVDSTQNWYTAAQFSRIPYEKETFSSKQVTLLEGRNKLVYWYYRANAERFVLLTFAYLAATTLAGLAIYNGELNVGAFAALTGYWVMVASPVMYLVADITDTADKLIDAEKLLVLLEKKPTITEMEDAVPFVFRGGQVEFENVFFTYDGNKTAADGLTFRSAPGKITAFVGETGGGKSTILKLMMRFYDPGQGRVLIDGQDVKYLQLESFRQHIAVVPQEPCMFHTTIMDNVRYTDPSISEDDVMEACKAVALHEKIMTFTKGYHTRVGERGCQLSGGEKQRLAIARAILKKPQILLLDEATSSVDSITERKIQTSLDQVCKDRSTFVIAHRLSTILKADQILVIEAGRVVESGQHADLIKKHGGVYHKLWKSQLKLQAERSRSRSASRRRNEEELVTLIDDVGDAADVVSLVHETDSPPAESTIQTPKEQASGDDHGRAVTHGFNALESLRRLVSKSPDPRSDGGDETKAREIKALDSSQSQVNTEAGNSGGKTHDQQDGASDAGSAVGLRAHRATHSEPFARIEDDSD